MQELSGVSEAARDRAMSRFRLIQPYLEERRSLVLVAADANLPFRTAQRWVSQYRKFGLAAFVRKARDDRGARRVVSPMIKAAIEGLALERPPLPVRSICRQVRAFAEARGEPMPGYGTVYDLVREVPSACSLLPIKAARLTAKAMIWCIDGKQPDQTPSGRQTTRSLAFS
jgi:putative transposase